MNLKPHLSRKLLRSLTSTQIRKSKSNGQSTVTYFLVYLAYWYPRFQRNYFQM